MHGLYLVVHVGHGLGFSWAEFMASPTRIIYCTGGYERGGRDEQCSQPSGPPVFGVGRDGLRLIVRIFGRH